MFDVLFERCAGLKVRKKYVMAAACLSSPQGAQMVTERFELTQSGVEQLRAWLSDLGVTDVGVEGMGMGWELLLDNLSDQFAVWVVDIGMFKHVPGRPPAATDAEWLAELMRHGLFAQVLGPGERRSWR